MLFWDSETHRIQPGLLAPPLVVGSFISPQADKAHLCLAEDTCDIIEGAIRDEEIIVGQNVAYDFAVLAAYRPSLLKPIFKHYRKGLVRDTKIREQLLCIADGTLKSSEGDDGRPIKTSFSLAAISEKRLGVKLAKGADTWRLRYAELDGVPLDQWPEEAKDYALTDAVTTRDVYLAQGGDIPNEIEQTQAAWALHLCSVWGIRTDAARVNALKLKMIAARAAVREELIAAGFYKAVPITPAEIAEGRQVEFWGEYKAKSRAGEKRPMRWGKDMAAIKASVEAAFATTGRAVPKAEGGGTSTDKDALERSRSPILLTLAEAGGIDKILDTYIPVLEGGINVPINAGFDVLKATGRTSSFNPNLQNLPTGRRVSGVRECFVPRVGYVFISVDYKTLEMRALAQWCLTTFGRSKMAEALRDGKDLHLAVAAQILRISYEEAEALSEVKDPSVKNARDFAKVLNFGVPGGMGGDALSDFGRTTYHVDIEPARAKELKRDFLAAWPEMVLYFRWHAEIPGIEHEQGVITQHISGRVRGGLKYTAACNQDFQGPASDGGKAALFEVSYECFCEETSPLYGSRPNAFIHDEILLEAPVDVASEAADRTGSLMIKNMARFIPDLPIEVSTTLMTCWSKEAESERDENGRWKIWSPAALNEETAASAANQEAA